MPIQVKPLSPGLLHHWLHFFDNVAFVDNADWSDCYCCCYQLDCTNEAWSKRIKTENRTTAQELILSQKMNGYLAFDGDDPVGWCNVNTYQSFPRLSFDIDKKLIDTKRDGMVASVICFIIAITHRGKGIARSLLKQAITDFSTNGFDAMEAYPRKGANLTPADQFHGPLQLYLNEGFEVVKEFEKYSLVRKNLR